MNASCLLFRFFVYLRDFPSALKITTSAVIATVFRVRNWYYETVFLIFRVILSFTPINFLYVRANICQFLENYYPRNIKNLNLLSKCLPYKKKG